MASLYGLAQVSSAVSQAANNRLQRTVMDKVPRHICQRAAAEPGRRSSEFPGNHRPCSMAT